MKELDVTWIHALRVWWAWLWRSMAIALPLSFLIGFLLGVFLSLIGVPIDENQAYFQLFGVLLGLYVGVYFMKRVLSMNFGKFRVAIIQVENENSVDA